MYKASTAMGQDIVRRFDGPKNSITNLTKDTKTGKNVGAGPASMTVQILAAKVTERGPCTQEDLSSKESCICLFISIIFTPVVM